MGDQLKDRKDLPATGNDLIQLADRIHSNFSLIRTFFNRVEYKFKDIDKLPGRISRHIVAAVASFTGLVAAFVAVTIQVMN